MRETVFERGIGDPLPRLVTELCNKKVTLTATVQYLGPKVLFVSLSTEYSKLSVDKQLERI